MSKVSLDTVGLLALWDEDDQWHVPAVKAFDDLRARRIRGVTTTFVLLECGNAAARTPYRLSVDRLRQGLDDDGNLLVPTAQDWNDAWEGLPARQYHFRRHCRSRIVRRHATIGDYR